VRARIGSSLTALLGVENLGNDKYWAFHSYVQRSIATEIAARLRQAGRVHVGRAALPYLFSYPLM
jgi:hypothetical protein